MHVAMPTDQDSHLEVSPPTSNATAAPAASRQSNDVMDNPGTPEFTSWDSYNQFAQRVRRTNRYL